VKSENQLSRRSWRLKSLKKGNTKEGGRKKERGPHRKRPQTSGRGVQLSKTGDNQIGCLWGEDYRGGRKKGASEGKQVERAACAESSFCKTKTSGIDREGRANRQQGTSKRRQRTKEKKESSGGRRISERTKKEHSLKKVRGRRG